MTDTTSRFDTWLTAEGPAALVLREHLTPVEGPDGVFFPPTYAASEDRTFAGGYNIDSLSEDGTRNVCLVDSVGSQANRLEPAFMEEPDSGLVPQVTIKAGEEIVNLLEAGHRAADAIVRCSALEEQITAAFQDVLAGNHKPLAQIAPTSLVFGAWDSRGTSAKVPRLVASTIRAYDVQPLKRSAVYQPPVGYVKEAADGSYDEKQSLLAEPDGKTKDVYSQRGFLHALATGTPGGVIAKGDIRRDATLSLAALRLLKADDDQNTLALRRYILGLALVALRQPSPVYLRQGCQLVLDVDKGASLELVSPDGTREALTLTLAEAREYATAAAEAFGVGKDQQVDFDKQKAKLEVEGKAKKPSKKKSTK